MQKILIKPAKSIYIIDADKTSYESKTLINSYGNDSCPHGILPIINTVG